jgi:hypothetical protein
MKKVLILVTVLVLVMGASAALAGDDAVTLDTSSVKDGQTDVPVDVVVELEFTNNVVNKSVADENAACITLTSQGEEVSIDIGMADDQVEPNKKRTIIVTPVEKLAEGTLYELKISGELSAKNGNKIGEDIIISFITAGEAANSGFAYWWIIVVAAITVIAVLTFFLLKKKNGNKE